MTCNYCCSLICILLNTSPAPCGGISDARVHASFNAALILAVLRFYHKLLMCSPLCENRKTKSTPRRNRIKHKSIAANKQDLLQGCTHKKTPALVNQSPTQLQQQKETSRFYYSAFIYFVNGSRGWIAVYRLIIYI